MWYVVWCEWCVSSCLSSHETVHLAAMNLLNASRYRLTFARAWHALCSAYICTRAYANVTGGGGPGMLTWAWLSTVCAVGCLNNAGVETTTLSCHQGKGGWGCCDQKGWALCSLLRVLSSQEASWSPQDSVSALLEQTAVELEAVEKKLEESRSTLTSGESW